MRSWFFWMQICWFSATWMSFSISHCLDEIGSLRTIVVSVIWIKMNGLLTIGSRKTARILVSRIQLVWTILLPFQEMGTGPEHTLSSTVDSLVKHFMFPDQDFLAEFFRGKWKAVGYQYNALKTMRYWHPEMWKGEEIRNLHYIVDKPWSERVGADGIAGYLGRDGVTHQWWWEEYESWETARDRMGETAVLEMVRKSSSALELLEHASTKPVVSPKTLAT